MITPQQIDQISFSQARHGYDMEQVDKILEPLTEDYVALYKENALLKSKMRVLVGKLEEYRKNEAAAKDAVESARRSADRMVQEAEAKCAQMMRQAQAAAAAAPAPAPKAPSADAFVAVENARVAEARKTAAARITEIQTQMQQCIQALDRIKNANVTPAAAPAAPAAAPAPVAPAAPKAPAKKEAPVDTYDSEAVVGEISQSLEAMVGTTNDTAPKAAPQHPTRDTSTSRFSTLNLQFGRNYDPTQK
ncbi:MAG: DivIVA domain-containing protein [Clostridiales bacterium]|nr:DivIVA domain-containing protein [Clostridiales bacterium]MCI6433637.1 DivIVA domain-containing protein [Clostridiales bacterium]